MTHNNEWRKNRSIIIVFFHISILLSFSYFEKIDQTTLLLLTRNEISLNILCGSLSLVMRSFMLIFSSLAFAFFRYFQLSFLNFSLDTHLCDKLFCSISIKKQIRVRRLNQTDVFKLWPLHIRFTSLLPIGWKFKISIFSFYFFLSSSMFSISFFFLPTIFVSFVACIFCWFTVFHGIFLIGWQSILCLWLYILYIWTTKKSV